MTSGTLKCKVDMFTFLRSKNMSHQILAGIISKLYFHLSLAVESMIMIWHQFTSFMVFHVICQESFISNIYKSEQDGSCATSSFGQYVHSFWSSRKACFFSRYDPYWRVLFTVYMYLVSCAHLTYPSLGNYSYSAQVTGLQPPNQCRYLL